MVQADGFLATKCKAVLVARSSYKDAWEGRFINIEHASKNLETVANTLLRIGFAEDDIVRLEDPNMEEVKTEIKKMGAYAQKLSEESPDEKLLVFFFFAGNGLTNKLGDLDLILDKGEFMVVNHKMRLFASLNNVTALSMYDCSRTKNPKDDGSEIV